MKNIVLLSLFVVGLLLRPPAVLAADGADTVVKVDKGDIVWSSGEGDTPQIFFSTYQSGKKAWSEPVQITADAYRNGHPVIDAGKSGKRVLVWTAGTGSDYVIRYAVGKNDIWSEPAEIPAQLKENLAPSVVIDKAGTTWVAWSANDGGQDDIYFARNSGDGWSIPARVNGLNQVPDILPVIALTAQGVPQVTWQGYRHDAYVQLQSTWNGESWSDEVELGPVAEAEQTAPGAEPVPEPKSNASIANMPSFIERPEEAYLRVYKSSIVK